MLKTLFIAAMLLAGMAGTPAIAAPAEKKLTIDGNEMLAIINAINALGGYQELDRNRNAVSVHYTFSSQTILTLADDRSRLVDAFKIVQEAAKAQFTKDKDHDDQVAKDILAVKRDVSVIPIGVSELRLDQNQGIPPGVVSDLRPILDGLDH